MRYNFFDRLKIGDVIEWNACGPHFPHLIGTIVYIAPNGRPFAEVGSEGQVRMVNAAPVKVNGMETP